MGIRYPNLAEEYMAGNGRSAVNWFRAVFGTQSRMEAVLCDEAELSISEGVALVSFLGRGRKYLSSPDILTLDLESPEWALKLKGLVADFSELEAQTKRVTLENQPRQWLEQAKIVINDIVVAKPITYARYRRALDLLERVKQTI
jgi:hypothetical protein